ncbi:chloride channel protein [Gluconacetobacter entanii]|uniref:Chloride channel protein n=1 Tax=Gluconacetobacter entanii TaxID=108528 RepID=A0ABT3K8M7_9PROT|nr:chloride channel protein [Gluconacetobacter entanii]MBE7620303.1 chloride channel protein [Komagataeibacter sp. FXV2]MCW4591743.1 chloride channel protein [Gluconacetobacter entanii]MCW4593562.1 chloride channel protein [Gluconacetobacter entanii]NPC88023.1 chloride channel protein [Gluconacetobacter entanii]
MKPDLTPARRRHLRRSARITTEQWRRKLACWTAAVAVGIVAVGFALAADRAAAIRTHLITWNPWIMLVVTPGGLALSSWLTRTWFRGAQGSGIPQTIATLNLTNFAVVDRLLTLRVAFGKIALTTLGLLAGASIGREGPTVQVGAAIMHTCGRWLNLSTVSMRRGLILAGGASGVAAAFNTPLAGIVFAIEELSHSFEQRTSGTMLTGVILSGVTAIALVGNYTYFGHTDVSVPIGISWIAVLTCGILGGVGGGVFSAILIRATAGLPGALGRFAKGHPVAFAAACGLVLALLGIASDGITYGTGYYQARSVIDGQAHYPASFFILKFIATIISYCSGIPGGLFAPSLAIGAGFGGWVAQFLPHTTPGAVVLLGMVGYFSAVVQSPLTASVIVMEMCDNQEVTLALLATAFLAYGVSRMICHHSLYSALAESFLGGVAKQQPPAPMAPIAPKQAAPTR